MTNQEMYVLHEQGTTYQAIADICGISRQAVHQKVHRHKRRVDGIRGHHFDIEKIVYKGVYDWFREHFDESIYSLCTKVYGCNCGNRHTTIRDFLKGEHNTYFTIEQIKRLCEIVGKPFEEVFERRG